MNLKRFFKYFFTLISGWFVTLSGIYVMWFLVVEPYNIPFVIFMGLMSVIALIDKYLLFNSLGKNLMKDIHKKNPVRKIRVIRSGNKIIGSYWRDGYFHVLS